MSEALDRLWSPWRMEYVATTKGEPQECFICAAWKSSMDRENLVLHRCALAFAVMNLYPYNNGHLLIAPHRHIAGLVEQTTEEITALGELLRNAVAWLDRAYKPDGYNIGLNLGRVAGAGLPGHLHYHIVPRWNGDTNFMPVLGFTKVVSEGLRPSYDRLINVIRELNVE
jgi:ATP adenylyltransferase